VTFFDDLAELNKSVPNLSNGCTNLASRFVVCGELYGIDRVYCTSCMKRISARADAEFQDGKG
jgi:hypothetical protein